MAETLVNLAAGQDYFWFLVLLLWGAVAALWWRDARDAADWRWLPWSAGAGALVAAIEIVAFSIPVRATPGVAPHFATERILAGAALLGLVGWIAGHRALRPALRVAAAVAVAGVGALGVVDPALGAYAYGGALVGLGAVLAVHATPAARWALAAVVGAGLCSSWGPVGEALGLARRWQALSAGSVAWSLAHSAAAAVALAGLRRHRAAPWIPPAVPAATARALRIAFFAWLAAGFLLAAVAGGLARRSFESSALARAEAGALLLDRARLGAFLGPAFTVTSLQAYRQPNGQFTPLAVVPAMTTPAALAVRQDLARLERANPDAPAVRLYVARDGRLLILPSSAWRTRAGTLAVLELDSPADWAEWSERQGYFQPPRPSPYGIGTEARAPVIGDDGRLLAWVVMKFPVGLWAAQQAQARLLVFLIFVGGLGLGFTFARERLRTLEREHARSEASLAARSDQLKTAFLAKVSHELRTPIQSILGYGELIRAAVTDPVVRQRLEAQREHGELMLRLVNDLLDLSAIQAGAFRLVPKPTPLVDLMQQAAESLAAAARAKGLGFSFVAEAEVPRWAMVDRERLRQIALNLIANAIKFTARGRIEVALSNGSEPGTVVLSVHDTGPGIAPHEQTGLFQPFSRLESAAGTEGTGLGLSLAAALCRSMGGGITVQSAVGEGSCFEATVRIRPCRAPESAGPAAAPAVSLAGLSVIVADDNALVRELFTAWLTECGAACRPAPDGDTACALARTQPPDAAVVDLAMPRGDGLSTLRRLRAEFGAAVRLIAVSAHAGESGRASALDAGADLYLVKPVELARLAAAIRDTPATAFSPSSPRTELLARLDAQFRADACAQRQAVVTALREADFAALAARAHYLRNSALAVADTVLDETCAELERAAAAAQPAAIAAAWARCDRALEPWTRPDSPAAPAVASAPFPVRSHRP